MPLSPSRWIVLTILLIAAGLSMREWSLYPDGHLHLHFLAVGQGDSALIVTPEGKSIVIDGGPDWSTLEGLGKYRPFLNRHIDLLVLSHPNLDHLLSFPEILKRYSVGGIALSGAENSLPRYREIFALAAKNAVPIITVSAGQTVNIEKGVNMNILWPPKPMPKGFPKNDNDQSVVLMLTYNGHRALFTGDEEHQVEETLVRSHTDLQANILKVAHHGSRTSSSTGFLLAVHPSLAVISVGENTYGHPRPEIVKRLEAMGAEVRRTDEDGTVEVVWK